MTLMISISGINVDNANAQLDPNGNPISQNCAEKATRFAHIMADTLDEEQARIIAYEYILDQPNLKHFTIIPGAISNEWTINNVNCMPDLEAVNVPYFLHNNQGYVRNLVITLTPDLSEIIKTDQYKSNFYAVQNSDNWDGYEFADGDNTTQPVYQAKAYYQHPDGKQPNQAVSGNPDCVNRPCEIAVWTGLTDDSGAENNHLVQAGSSSRVLCTSQGNCTTSYFMWYEFLPNAAVFCGGALQPNDFVLTDIVNQKKDGGSSTKYNIAASSTSGALCSVTGQTYSSMSNPTLAPFINERPCFSGCSTQNPTFTSLADFDQDTITGWIWYDNALRSISTTDNFNEFIMDNNPVGTNISHGTPSSSFTAFYNDSKGT